MTKVIYPRNESEYMAQQDYWSKLHGCWLMYEYLGKGKAGEVCGECKYYQPMDKDHFARCSLYRVTGRKACAWQSSWESCRRFDRAEIPPDAA